MKSLLTFSLLLFFCSTPYAQDELPTFIEEELTAYIEKGMKDWNIPAVAVGIIQDGEVILAEGFGSTSAGQPLGESNAEPQATDAETLFMIGSNTKLFTATALGHLAAQGKLDAFAPVVNYLPEFRLRNQLAGENASVVDLLSHQIGFATFQGDFTYWTSKLSREEVIARMALVEAPYGFRTNWGYCNACFVAAGEVIPRITDQNWSAYIQTNILDPLEMDRTVLLSRDLPAAENVAQPHSLLEGELVRTDHVNIDNLAAAGSMSSSVNDMLKWLKAQTDLPALGAVHPSLTQAIGMTRQPQSILGMDPRNGQDTHFYLYGAGLMINDRMGKLVFSHTGGVNGYLSSVVIVPELKLGIVVLTNTDQNAFYQSLSDQIRDAFLEIPFRNYSEEALMNFQRSQAENAARIAELREKAARLPAPTLDLPAYTGTYSHEFYGTISLKQDGDELLMQFEQHPRMTARLQHLGEDVFLCTYSDHLMGIMEIPFTVADGAVQGLDLKVNDFIEATVYSFTKE